MFRDFHVRNWAILESVAASLLSIFYMLRSYGQYILLFTGLRECFWSPWEFLQWIIAHFLWLCRTWFSTVESYWFINLTNYCLKLYLAGICVNYKRFIKITIYQYSFSRNSFFIFSKTFWCSLVQYQVVCLEVILVRGVYISDLFPHISL